MNCTLSQLHRDLVPLLGFRAAELLRVLHKRDGEVCPDAWKREVEKEIEEHGRGYACAMGLPLIMASGASALTYTPTGALICWLQRLRLEVGEDLEVFAPLHKGQQGYSLWWRVSKWFAAQVGEHCPEGWENAQRTAAKKLLREWVCARYGLTSSRHIPASIWSREVTDVLLQVELRGLPAVLEEARAQLYPDLPHDHDIEYDWDEVNQAKERDAA